MPKTLVISLILASTLTGCAPFLYSKGNTDDSYTKNTHNWYALPSTGSQITIYNKNTDSKTTVTVIDSYHAASGRTCSLYSINGSMDTSNPSGLACRSENRWVFIPFIVNPDAHTDSG